MENKRLLTGDRPTGPLHLGHYFGTLENRVRLQNEGYDSFIIIADYQVLTDRLETEPIKQNIYELTKDYIAVGLDPKKTTFFVQSMVPELAELTMVFSMLVSVSRISRNPTVKEEIKKMELDDTFSLGMFSYPASQAADILLFNPGVVPVGDDQLPHIELTREIAKRFNHVYGDVFYIPEAMLGKTPRLKGLDGTDKMSKSRNNAIFLSDDEAMIRKKVKSAKTDTGNEVRFDPDTKPEISNLLELFHLTTGISIEDLEAKYKDGGYGVFKQDLADALVTFLKPIQERRAKVTTDDVQKYLKEGTESARNEGIKTMAAVRKAMNMDYEIN